MADIGLLPGLPYGSSRAVQNTERLTAALNSGNDAPISLPRGDTTYFYGTSLTNTKVGCGVIKESNSCRGYPVNNHPTLTGNIARIVQLKDNTPWLRVRGAGFTSDCPFELVGPGTLNEAAIEIEGRLSPATGLHSFNNICFQNWGSCFRSLPGYYDDDDNFVDDENHADNVYVERCSSFGCPVVYLSQNQQAVNWNFNNFYAAELDGPDEMIFADIERGGVVWLNYPVVAHNRFTFFRVRDFSPNTASLVVHEFEQDNMTDPDAYITLFNYNGPVYADDMSDWHWRVRCSGFSPFDNAQIAASPWLVIPDGIATTPIDRSDITWDVRIFQDYVEA